jgi:ABC-type nitrate/sulfonate/bicarbonate transport system permease component
MASRADAAAPLGRRAARAAPAVVLPLLSVSVVLGLWELAPRAGWVRRESVPPFSDVMGEVIDVLGRPEFLENLGGSAERWAIGFGLAILIGIPLGTLMGRFRPLYTLVDPLLVVGYPVPKAALILLFVLWWGAGDTSRIGIIVVGCLIPIVISSYHGAHAIEPGLLWSARGLGTGRIRLWFRVILPAALPQILSGLRLGIAISIFTLLASELLIRGSGIGAYMFTALDNGQTLTVFAMSTIIATIGFLLDFAYVTAVKRGLPWFEGEV